MSCLKFQFSLWHFIFIIFFCSCILKRQFCRRRLGGVLARWLTFLHISWCISIFKCNLVHWQYFSQRKQPIHYFTDIHFWKDGKLYWCAFQWSKCGDNFLHHVISNYCSYFIWKHRLINLEDLSHWSFESAATPEQSSNGYLLIATSGGLNQQRTGVSFYRNELLQEVCMDMLLNCQYQYKKKKQLHIMF